MSWISTASAGRFYYGEPNEVNIEDIACALGNLCRFTGQIDAFYSIAEHSWHTSYLVPPEHRLCALLHDGTEAYVNDLAKPLKRHLPDYNAMEDHVWRHSIAPTFGLPLTLPPCVKDADMAMLKTEVMQLYPPHVSDELTLPGPAANVRLHFWEPRMARYRFLERFRELTA